MHIIRTQALGAGFLAVALMLQAAGAAGTNTVPWGDSFESYPDGSSVIGLNGWAKGVRAPQSTKGVRRSHRLSRVLTAIQPSPNHQSPMNPIPLLLAPDHGRTCAPIRRRPTRGV